MPLQLKIITPKGTMLETPCDEVYLPTSLGPVGVLPGHTRAVFSLKEAGILHFKYQEKTSYYTVFSGAVSVEDDFVLLSSPLAEDARTIDLARAQEAKERADARLKREKEEIDVKRARLALGRALIRIEAKSLSHGEKK